MKAAELSNIKMHSSGTCITIEGPRFSSKAESLLFKSWGAHVVNMTTVPECVLAKEAGMCYAAVAMATDYDCWHTHEEKVNVELALRTFRENIGKVIQVLCAAIPLIATQDWSDTIQNLKVKYFVFTCYYLYTALKHLLLRKPSKEMLCCKELLAFNQQGSAIQVPHELLMCRPAKKIH